MRCGGAFVASFVPFLTFACLLPEEREGLSKRIVSRQTTTNGTNGIPIGAGDRYNSGTIAPRGLGTQTTILESVLSVAEIASGMKALENVYGISTFTTPFMTYNNATILSGKIRGSGGACDEAYRVYLNGNLHARERGSADGLLLFVGDLLYADKNNIGLTYGSKSYTNAQVKTVLSVGIIFTPLSNPDGVVYDQASNSCWRKNRNPASEVPGYEASIGVDINRNFDFLWDFTKKFAPSAQSNTASTSPFALTYHGTSPFSEPEAQSVKWIMDTYSKIRWFVDLHSYAGDVLYPWGSDEDQSEYPYMNYMNSIYDGVRGILTDTPGVDSGYGEYIPVAEKEISIKAATRISDAMTAATGRNYTAKPSAELYPNCGTSDEYAYSRHFSDTSKNLIYAFTVEFGFSNRAATCPFYPDETTHNQNIQEIGAAFMEQLLVAAEIGLGDPVVC